VRSIDVRALTIVAIGACAAAPSAPITSKRGPIVATGIPSLFAPLFRDGARWTFDAETTVGDGAGHHDTKPGRITCSIAHTRALAHAWLAELACTGIVADQSADGVLVATAAGLWHVETPLAEMTDARVAELAPTSMSIDATPHTREHTNTLSENEQETYTVQRGAGDSWCFNYGTNLGDERGWMLCIDAAKGLVGGSAFWSGNKTTITSFGAVPPG